jgi:hypothetical protein
MKSGFCVWLFVAMMLPATSSAQQARAPALERVVADVPMLARGSSPAVHVTVNGEGPFLFLIDTGAQGKARADSSLVAKLALRRTGTTDSGDGSGRSRTLEEVTFDELRIGSLRFRRVNAPSRDYNGSARVTPIAGILGFNLFHQHLLTLDFINRRVRVETGSLPPADGKTILDYDAPYDTPIIEAVMGGFRLAADIDSGDTSGISFPATLVRILPQLSEPRAVATGQTVSNTFVLNEVKLRGVLRIGEHELPDPTVRFNEVHDNINLGAAFLSGYILTFDQRNRRVRIIPSAR